MNRLLYIPLSNPKLWYAVSDTKHILKSYGEYSVKLAQLLRDGEKLHMDDQIFIENHLLIVQLAITALKHGKPKKLGSLKL
jgi:hypothetical protein